MIKFVPRVVMASLLITTCAECSTHSSADPKLSRFQRAAKKDCSVKPHVELDATVGNQRSIGTINLFAPLVQNKQGNIIKSILFADIRGRWDTQNSREVNVGLGYREIINDRFILGTYGFFDVQRSPRGHIFKMITLGVEYLSEKYEARFNAYIPERKKFRIARSVKPLIIGNFFAMGSFENQRYDAALSGFDAEVGTTLVLPMRGAEFQLLAGGYYFARSGLGTVSGPRLRARFRFNDWVIEGDRLTLGVDLQRDKPRGMNAFFNIALRVPFTAKKCMRPRTPIEKRLDERIVRDVDIVVSPSSLKAFTQPVALSYFLNSQGQRRRIFFVGDKITNRSSVPGSQENPHLKAEDAFNAANQVEDFIRFLPGTHVVNNATLTADGIDVSGSQGSVVLNNLVFLERGLDSILQNSSLGGAMINISNMTAKIHDLQFNLRGIGKNAIGGIYDDPIHNVVIENAVFQGGSGKNNGVAIFNKGNVQCNLNANNVQFLNFTGVGSNGILIKNTDQSMSNITLVNAHFENNFRGISVVCDGSSMMECTVTGATANNHFDPNSCVFDINVSMNAFMRNLAFNNCTMNGNLGTGINVMGSGSSRIPNTKLSTIYAKNNPGNVFTLVGRDNSYFGEIIVRDSAFDGNGIIITPAEMSDFGFGINTIKQNGGVISVTSLNDATFGPTTIERCYFTNSQNNIVFNGNSTNSFQASILDSVVQVQSSDSAMFVGTLFTSTPGDGPMDIFIERSIFDGFSVIAAINGYGGIGDGPVKIRVNSSIIRNSDIGIALSAFGAGVSANVYIDGILTTQGAGAPPPVVRANPSSPVFQNNKLYDVKN